MTNICLQNNYIKLLILARFLTSKNIMDNHNIQTFVFLDSETTGLPFQEYNKTKLTELCLASVQSDHISLGVYPRVLNKLSFCFNPRKLISSVSTEITGLSNDLLEFQPEFQEETVSIIEGFLNLQRKPICFVAHNGNFFDYPILRAEIEKTGRDLSDDILCIDSLQAFRELHQQDLEEQKNIAINILPTQPAPPIEFSDGFDELLCSIADELEDSYKKTGIQKINETTPVKKSGSHTVNDFNGARLDNCADISGLYYNGGTTVAGMLTTAKSNFRSKNVRQSLLQSRPTAKKNGRLSFKLTDVYTRLTNKEPEDAHRAEQDVTMLIECAATVGQRFTDWANVKAKKFCDMPVMKPGRKLGS